MHSVLFYLVLLKTTYSLLDLGGLKLYLIDSILDYDEMKLISTKTSFGWTKLIFFWNPQWVSH